MSELTALEGRLTAAMNRIRVGVDGLSAGAAPADDTALQAQLSEERTANAQLEERVKALKERQDHKIAELEARVASYRKQMSDLDAELQRLRTSNADLRDVNGKLRAAATDGVADSELLNRALMAELDFAEQDQDRLELEIWSRYAYWYQICSAMELEIGHASHIATRYAQ